jgi:hypothetical protein
MENIFLFPGDGEDVGLGDLTTMLNPKGSSLVEGLGDGKDMVTLFWSITEIMTHFSVFVLDRCFLCPVHSSGTPYELTVAVPCTSRIEAPRSQKPIVFYLRSICFVLTKELALTI